jgi:error-prone DNA polymerase
MVLLRGPASLVNQQPVCLARGVTDLVALPVKSHYSMGLGTAAPYALVQHARRLGYRSLGLADVENVYGQVQFHVACRTEGLVPVTGIELRARIGAGGLVHSATQGGRVVLLAKNARGYAHVCRVVTLLQRADGSAPRCLDPHDVLGADVIALTDDPASLEELVNVGGPGAVRALLVRPRSASPEAPLLAAARRLEVPWVAGLDATSIQSADRTLLHVLERARHQATGGRPAMPSVFRELLAPARLAALFSDVPEALREAALIAQSCSLDLLAFASPPADPPRAVRELRALCTPSLHERLAAAGEKAAAHSARFETELAAIAQLGLCEPFTAVAALVADARRLGIPTLARGSAVSSLVGHVLGFSPVDPLAQGLFFERFASPARRTPPDIDLDVASRQRDVLLNRFVAARGPERTARLTSVQTYGQRSAYRKGLAALGAPRAVIEPFMRQLPSDELLEAGHPVPGTLLPPRWRRQLGTLRRLVGIPRHVTLHPSGVVLGRAPLTDWLALKHAQGEAPVSQYDAESLAHLGLMKVDLLGSHCLDTIAAASSALRPSAPQTDRWAWANVPLDDRATFDRIQRAQTIGCHQLESPLMRGVLARLPVQSLDDLAHALALVRPGPGSGQAKELFIERARLAAGQPARASLDPANDPLWPALRPIDQIERWLAKTHHLLLFEEDILFVLASATGIPLDKAEALRVTLQRRADDTEWLERARRRFVAQSGSLGLAVGDAERLWSSLVRFARYTFNKAHAASQARLAYQSAYLATHAPVEHGCALLNHHAGLYPRRVIAAELARRGVTLRLPCLLRSELEGSVEPDSNETRGPSIRIGLGHIRSLRVGTREALLALRGTKAFVHVGDLLQRVRLGGGELAALVRSGACDRLLSLSRVDYPWVHEAVLEHLIRGGAPGLDAVIDQTRAALQRQAPARLERERAIRSIQNELRYLEMFVSDHPMRVLREDADRLGCVTSQQLDGHRGQRILFAGIVAAARRVPLNGATVTQYITLEDEHGLVEACIPPQVFGRLKVRLSTPGPYLVEARVTEQQHATSLAVESLLPFYQRPRREGWQPRAGA